MARHVVGRVEEIPPGERKIVELEGRSIGVFNIAGEFYALRNACPHQGAPLCLGQLVGRVEADEPGRYRYHRDGEIVRCPWHLWEFDVKTGASMFNPHRVRVRSYDVRVEHAEEDPSVETYPTHVDAGVIVVEVGGALAPPERPG